MRSSLCERRLERVVRPALLPVKTAQFTQFFTSGMTSHSKIAQFNWEYIGCSMPCHKYNSEYLVFCPDKTDVRKPKGSCKAFSNLAQGNVAFWMVSYLLRDQGMSNIRKKCSDLEQKICLQTVYLEQKICLQTLYLEPKICLKTVSFVTVCIFLKFKARTFWWFKA